MKPDYVSKDGTIELYNDDCMAILPFLKESSANLIATDPPYYKVKAEGWDRQWDKFRDFLGWIGRLCEQWQRVLVPNGSLYCFASPQARSRVSVEVGKWFHVVSEVTWAKPCPFSEINKGASNSGRVSAASLRGFYPNTEAIIFAEHFNADNIAKGEAGYQAKCNKLRGFVFEPLRAYLDGERERAGVTKPQVNKYTGTQMASHWFSRSQWALPTERYYNQLRQCLSELSHNGEYLRREYEELRREYEELRREYEELRREYEELRRPFSVTTDVPYTDVWAFPTVQAYKGKHPCEKPLAMMEHIVSASSRDDATVLDCFMGSGTTGIAAAKMGRRFIGIEKDHKYFGQAVRRIEEAMNAEPLLAGVQ